MAVAEVIPTAVVVSDEVTSLAETTNAPVMEEPATTVEQTASGAETNTEVAEAQEVAVAETAPTEAIVSDEVASAEEATDAPVMEEPATTVEQTASGAETNTEVAEAQEVAVAETAPTEAVVSDEVASAEEATDATPAEEAVITEEKTLFTLNDVTYEEIMWDGLIPADFTSAAIMAKYEEQLAELEDGSSEASDLYIQMQEEFNNAPVNEALDETFVRIPGFITPLEYSDELITEFLLVPYFGACIHVPPPPSNQTVLVKTGEGYGITLEESYNPIWVMGKLITEGVTTDLAEAGYYMEDVIIEPYTSP